MRLPGGRRAGRIAVVLVLAAPPSASAAVRLGPDVSQPLPSGGMHLGALGCQPGQYSPCSFVNLRSTNADAAVASPYDGVIVRWRLRGGCCTNPQATTKTLKLATFTLGQYDGLGGYGYAIKDLVGPSFEIPPGNQLLADTPLDLPARLPVKAGQRPGLVADEPIGLSVYDTIPGVASVVIANTSTYLGEGYGTIVNAAIALSVDIEPDADHDAYGDETQDCQPADPALHGTDCEPPPVGPPLVTPTPGGVNCSPSCGAPGPSKAAVYPLPVGPLVASGDGTRFYISLQCPPTAALACGGYLVIEPAGGKKAAHGAAARLRVAYSIAVGKRAKVRLPLSRALLKQLRRTGKLRLRVRIEPAGGTATTFTRTLRVKRRARR